MKKGFTLVELLISIALMTIIGTVTVAMISTVLRSSKNTTLAGDIRQSGNYVLEQISDTARYATQFKMGNADNLGSLDPGDATTYTQDCSTPVTSQSIAFTTSADDKERIFYCDATAHTISYQLTTDLNYSPDGFSSLIDTSAVTVPSSSCSITCSQSGAGAPPTIGISFNLSQVTSPGVTPLPENNVNLQFSTSTLMRNINN